MDLESVMKARRTAHQYEPGVTLDRKTIDKSIELALLAPNHKFTFPWRFIVVGDKTRRQLVDQAVQLKVEKLSLLVCYNNRFRLND